MKKLNMLFVSVLLAVALSMTGTVSADDGRFSQAELDSMLAPVALYPDSVLSHLLIASTYPLEVIQAARFAREHPDLRGEEAVAAADAFDWDPSVKALAAFPELLARMDEDLDWTQRLGDAFLMQEAEVLASIQYLRQEAYAQGSLQTNEHVQVVREKEYIYIEPAQTRVVYVPYYDPRVVWVNWRWAAWPPVYWHRPVGYTVGLGFYWGHPYYVQPSFYFSSFHWATRRVVVVNHHHYYYNDRRFRSARQVASFNDARPWQHNPVHRRGVSYRGPIVETRFVDNRAPAGLRTNATSNASLRANAAAGGNTRAVARSDQRAWAAERRSSLDVSSRAAAAPRSADSSARSTRVAELRGNTTSGTVAGSSRSVDRSPAQSSSRSPAQSSSRSSATAPAGNRTVSGRAPARASDAAPSRSAPTAPARSAPAAPARSAPAAPARSAPAAPARSAPAAPARSAPAAPARSAPAAPARSAPAAPARSAPAAPARSAPAAPARSAPAAPARSAPSTPTRSAPRSSGSRSGDRSRP